MTRCAHFWQGGDDGVVLDELGDLVPHHCLAMARGPVQLPEVSKVPHSACLFSVLCGLSAVRGAVVVCDL